MKATKKKPSKRKAKENERRERAKRIIARIKLNDVLASIIIVRNKLANAVDELREAGSGAAYISTFKVYESTLRLDTKVRQIIDCLSD